MSHPDTGVREAVGHAHGKLIVLGEHAVVYGHAALAMPLPQLRCTATVTLMRDAPVDMLELVSGTERLCVSHPAKASGFWGGTGALLAALRDELPDGRHGLRCVIESTIPVGAGLGSGAAVACAIARAWSDLVGCEADEQTLHARIQIAERVTHGNPSGLDACTVAALGPLLFDRSQGGRALDVSACGYWVVAHSGVARQTALAIAGVAQRLESEPERTRKALDRLGDLATLGARAMVAGDVAGLGALLNDAHDKLTGLGVSHPRLDELVGVARQHGAVGAKLTGAGLGGCVLALAESETAQARVAKAWREGGATVVLCVNGEGMADW